MRIKTKSDQREGSSTQFNKTEIDELYVKFETEVESRPVSDINIFLEKKKQWCDFRTALRNKTLVVSGSPEVHFREP